uniref:Solute carrier family 25 member 17 n=1 Tax=Calidris pygmaea TaxID=425635 RepID=A0A8C3KQK8_9CHAR
REGGRHGASGADGGQPGSRRAAGGGGAAATAAALRDVFHRLLREPGACRVRGCVDEKRKSKTTPAVLLEIIKEEGLLAPYRGWFPVISSLCCSNFVYFYTFNSLKALWVKGQHSTTGKDLVLGVVAGVVNVLLTTPLWVVNTRLKLQGAKFRNEDIVPTNYKGIIDAFHQIIRDEGVLALWNGTFPSLLLVFNPAIQFMFYEGSKRKLLKKQLQLTSLDAFVIGAIAKAVATTLTYPLQTVQSILRFGRHRLNPENRTLGSLRNVLYLLQQRVSREEDKEMVKEVIILMSSLFFSGARTYKLYLMLKEKH